MLESISDIKRAVDNYFQTAAGVEKLYSSNRSSSNTFNKELFELEVLVQMIKERQKIDLNLNPTISSQGIMGSFEAASIDTYFKPVDYQLNFLYHLARHYDVEHDLHRYILSFANEFKNQLAYPDIKVTSSGATRIFTNLRFTVNDLRNLGLVLRRNESGKRIFLPSVFGLFVLIYIQQNNEIYARQLMYKPFSSLKLTDFHNGYHPKSFQFDSMLSRAIREFDTIDLMEVVGNLSLQELTADNKLTLAHIIKSYTEYVLDILEISDDGIKTKKEFENKTKAFLSKAEKEQIIPGIHGKLLGLFRELSSGQK